MSYSSRFWLYAPIAIFLGIAAVVVVHWYAVEGQVERKLDALNGHEAAPGITISFTSRKISGVPFNIDVVFENFAISGDGAHGPFRWTSQNFALHRLTYGRAQDIYEAAGNQALSWTDGGGRTHALTFLPASLHASAITDDKGLLRFDLEVMDAGGHDSSGSPFTAADAQLHLRRDPKADAMDLELSGADIATRENMAGVLGNKIKSIKLYATLTQGSVFGPLLAGTGKWADASAAWHAKGGQVTLGPIEIHASGLNLTANQFGDTGGDLAELFDPLY